MKKVILGIMLIVSAFLFVGCSESVKYIATPTPLKKESSHYYVKNLKVNLQHGHGRNLENKTFTNEQELSALFAKDIKDSLIVKQLFSESGFGLSIMIDYTRKYNYGGNALNKPEFSYTVDVYDSANTIIAQYGIAPSTTKYAYFEDIGVNLKIGTFQWGAEDEPRDIALISKTLVREVSQFGK